ncbi:MAG: tripartite tricarboxylate transporter substrate binding protein [Burkholderiales bacterium]
MNRFIRAISGIVTAYTASFAFAQGYPSKPIKMIAPFPPAGTSDVLGRFLAQKLTEGLGQTVVVENRPGASANIGHEIASKAAPDGYTIILSNNGAFTINPLVFKRMPFDAINDFVPITLIAAAGQVLIVHPTLSAKTVDDVIALAKAKPDFYNFGSGGIGIPSHITGELFNRVTGTRLTHIPYKGTGQAVLDLVAAQLHMVFADMVPAVPQIKSGRVRAIAVTSPQRMPILPDVPTMAEAGAAGVTSQVWWAMLAPKGVPAEVVTRLNTELGRIVKLPDVQERYASLGLSTLHSAPQTVHEWARKEAPDMAKLLEAAGIKPE